MGDALTKQGNLNLFLSHLESLHIFSQQTQDAAVHCFLQLLIILLLLLVGYLLLLVSLSHSFMFSKLFNPGQDGSRLHDILHYHASLECIRVVELLV